MDEIPMGEMGIAGANCLEGRRPAHQPAATHRSAGTATGRQMAKRNSNPLFRHSDDALRSPPRDHPAGNNIATIRHSGGIITIENASVLNGSDVLLQFCLKPWRPAGCAA
jgi:hypothetical protein